MADHGVRAGQLRKSFIDVLLVLERRVSDNGNYSGYRWVAQSRGYGIVLETERDLATLPLLADDYFSEENWPFGHYTPDRVAEARVEDAERWGLK